MPSRPSCSRLMRSQFERTRSAVRASTSPKTCGWRRTSFLCTPRATCARSPAPRSSSRSARKYTWNRRSPSSSSSFSSSSASAASATSYASSTVCGTIVAAVCSRSQGQSRRNRSVRRCSSTRAAAASPPSAAGTSAGRRGLRRNRGRRGGRRLVARLVGDLARVVLLHLREEVRPRKLLLLLGELQLDLRLDLGEGLLVGRSDRRQRLDDVPAVDALHGLRDRVSLERERGLVERGHGLLTRAARTAVRDAELAAVLRRARVLRVLLRQRREALPVLELRLDLVCERLAVDEDVPDLAGLRSRVGRRVLVVVVLCVGRGDVGARGHLLLELLAEERRADVVLLEICERDVVRLQRVLELLLVAVVVRLLDVVEVLGDVLVRHRHA